MRRSLAVAFALVVAGCGAANGTNPTDGGTDGAPAAAQVDYAVTPLSFHVGPGEELIQCQYFPADGKQRYINRFVTDMSAGSHHLVVFRVDENKAKPMQTGLFPCMQIDIPAGFDGMLPGSQQPHTDFTLPDGVAFKMEAYHGVLLQMHYINATNAGLDTKVTWALGTAKSYTQEAGMIFYSNFSLNIRTGMSTAMQTCKAPADLKIITATGHMHKHGLTFDASVAGTSIFHTDNWDEPNQNVFPAPGFVVKLGDPITWACAYNNNTGMPLQFGNSAATNEMCILAALYYPATASGTEFFCR